MKTNYLILPTIAASALFLSSCGSHDHPNQEENTTPETETAIPADLQVDLGTSTVTWTGEMMGMYTHHGTVAISQASLSVAGDKVVDGKFTVDLSTITPTDENYKPADGKTPEKLVGHLSSPDFFDVANHPTASFEITDVSEDGSSITGNLTVRGITNVETVNSVSVSNGSVTGTLTFDRTKYEVAFSHPMKEMVISNDVKLEIALKVAG